MTISEAISKWLAEYGEIVVDTNHVSDGSDQYGLFKSPQRNIVSHVDSSNADIPSKPTDCMG